LSPAPERLRFPSNSVTHNPNRREFRLTLSCRCMANITWRQQVGGSAIEASKITGHSDLEMTGEYTFVTPERQNELTRLIQQKLAQAAAKTTGSVYKLLPAVNSAAEPGDFMASTVPATRLVH